VILGSIKLTELNRVFPRKGKPVCRAELPTCGSCYFHVCRGVAYLGLYDGAGEVKAELQTLRHTCASSLMEQKETPLEEVN